MTTILISLRVLSLLCHGGNKMTAHTYYLKQARNNKLSLRGGQKVQLPKGDLHP